MSITKKQVSQIQEAKKAVVDGRLALWNLRLEALGASGDGRSVLDAMTSTVEDSINNCGCNVQCGAL